MSSTATEVANVTVTVLISLLDLAIIPVKVILILSFAMYHLIHTLRPLYSITSDEIY